MCRKCVASQTACVVFCRLTLLCRLTALAAAPDGDGGILQPVARVRLVSSQGDVLQVKTTRIGRASVCAPEGGFAGVPPC